jgi:hypothetical protein
MFKLYLEVGRICNMCLDLIFLSLIRLIAAPNGFNVEQSATTDLEAVLSR